MSKVWEEYKLREQALREYCKLCVESGEMTQEYADTYFFMVRDDILYSMYLDEMYSELEKKDEKPKK